MSEVDNGFKAEGTPPRRFYMQRNTDVTGVSRTGRVLEGVLFQDGKVVTQWRPPHSTMGIYNDLAEFMTIHVDSHPDCNEVVWLDDDDDLVGEELIERYAEHMKGALLFGQPIEEWSKETIIAALIAEYDRRNREPDPDTFVLDSL